MTDVTFIGPGHPCHEAIICRCGARCEGTGFTVGEARWSAGAKAILEGWLLGASTPDASCSEWSCPSCHVAAPMDVQASTFGMPHHGPHGGPRR